MTADLLHEVDTLNARLKAYPLPASLRASIEADWEVSQTYNSNAIEGNTLSLAETKAVLLDGVTVSGHPLREHLEAVNHREAWRLMRRMAAQPAPLSEDDVLALHRTILTGIQSDDAGVYRRDRVRVVGSSRIFPNPLKVPDLMGELIADLNTQASEVHPVILAARAHYGLVAVHPFIDGNGRTARLLMNLLLIRAGYPPALIPVTGRAEYYAALEEANGGNLAPFEALVTGRVLASVRDLLAVVGDGEEESGPGS
ncbi:Fic family protein [Deinococcus sp. YIM 77859]|uniref:Fic family protein n=1 Tax=Deinococcus sp. YIM 77859 TaxID=1540221 RepID=UPI00068F3B5E|nr:Fic family protein [Deinococcus sp. YIM 77859]